MRRVLLQSAAFARAARRLLKKNPDAASSLQAALESLAETTSLLRSRFDSGYKTASFS